MSAVAVDFIHHTTESAPEAARARMLAAEAKFGFLPAPVALMASSPELLDGFLTINAIFNRCSLDAIEREVVIMAIATNVECHYCVAMHSATLVQSGADGEFVQDLRDKRPLRDPRLEALRVFTLAVMDTHGAVSDNAMRELIEAGFTTRSALDVVLGWGTYTLSMAANRLTGAPLDAAFAPFAWDPQA